MLTIGIFEAKTTLCALIDYVAGGDHVLITRRGVPVARITQAIPTNKSAAAAARDQLKSLRSRTTMTHDLHRALGL